MFDKFVRFFFAYYLSSLLLRPRVFLVHGVYLKKKLTRGSAYFFGSEICDVLILGVWKRLLYFFGSEKFFIYFLGQEFSCSLFWVSD